MANTPGFGWETPDDTDLVKDGAAAMRTLGNAIDASLVDLKGGTTNQILAKNSNTDMDFKWVANDVGDITAVTAGTGLSGGGTSGDVTLTNTVATTFDAKGDLVVGTGADTFAKLVAGSNGDTLVADSSATTGLRWQGNFAAGKNAIINGDFRIWQRGTSFSNPKGVFLADRYAFNYDGTGNLTASQQTFTAGTAPVAGYEGQFFLRLNQTTAGSGTTFSVLQQPIEDVRTFAGQTVTVSFWAKADATRTLNVTLRQDFGSGGSSVVDTAGSGATLTTSWVRYTNTITVPSVSGKTIGTGSALRLFISLPINTTQTIDIWGVQVEAGNVATAFQTATGTLAGELAACQRYYQRISQANGARFLSGLLTATSTTNVQGAYPLATSMRTTPTVCDFSNVSVSPDNISSGLAASSVTISGNSENGNVVILNFTVSGATQYRPYIAYTNNTNGFLGIGAEL